MTEPRAGQPLKEGAAGGANLGNSPAASITSGTSRAPADRSGRRSPAQAAQRCELRAQCAPPGGPRSTPIRRRCRHGPHAMAETVRGNTVTPHSIVSDSDFDVCSPSHRRMAMVSGRYRTCGAYTSFCWRYRH